MVDVVSTLADFEAERLHLTPTTRSFSPRPVSVGQAEVDAADCAHTWIAAGNEGLVLRVLLVLKDGVGAS